MNSRHWIALGCLLGALGVATGAFGAHGLEGYLNRRAENVAEPPGEQGQRPAAAPERRLQTFETAVRYQMYHALALVAVGAVARRTSRPKAATLAGWLLLAGVLIFSGLLYALVLTGAAWLGAIVPIGGVALIAGWTALAVAAWGVGE